MKGKGLLNEDVIGLAKQACQYLNDSPDPYHAVRNSAKKLQSAGFTELSVREMFTGKVSSGGKYYYTLNKTTLVAFAVGPRWKSGNGFKLIGGHTDSPNLKVKPRSQRSASGCLQLGVECYGGGLWHTWFDRDLGISGRVLVRPSEDDGAGMVQQKLVRIARPIARVSSLCIHLQTAEEMSAFKINKEEHLSPILGTKSVLQTSVAQQLNGDTHRQKEDDTDDAWTKCQEPLLLELLAEELQISTKQIADFELNLFDTQPATLGGIKSEFIFSARLDNLATCFVATESLIDHSSSEHFQNDAEVSIVVLFDHEEIGSESAHGAASPVVEDAVRRISTALNSGKYQPDLYGMTISNSFLFSVDQAHAIHPNYAGKHEKNHAPEMNAGVVLKINQNQRYSTNSVTSFIVREICRRANIVPLQEFVVRNDCRCGSTIGPIISAKTGIRTVDVGMPQLSMHSCREVMGIIDLTTCLDLFKGFFKYFNEIDSSLEGDVFCNVCDK